MTAATAVEVDAATIAAIDAAAAVQCEVRVHRHVGGRCVDRRCDQTAEWVCRTRCAACGRLKVKLICQPHHDRVLACQRRLSYGCAACGVITEAQVLSLERISR